jgi:hypothetical protein
MRRRRRRMRRRRGRRRRRRRKIISGWIVYAVASDVANHQSPLPFP